MVCDGGEQIRERTLYSPATGSGSCTGFPSNMEGTEFVTEGEGEEKILTDPVPQRCNEIACPKDDALKCEDKVDVIIALDSSGSVGEDAWKKVLKFAKDFIGSFDQGKDADPLARIGLINFSGPKNVKEWFQCKRGRTAENLKVCQVNVVSRLTTDLKSVLGKVDSLKFIGQSTQTSTVISTALSEFRSEPRPDADSEFGMTARSILLVVTDGKPNSRKDTWRAAGNLRRDGRELYFVSIGLPDEGRTKDMIRWGGREKEHVLITEDFDYLQSSEFRNEIMAGMCDYVVGPGFNDEFEDVQTTPAPR